MTKRTGNKHSDLENSDKVQNPAEKQWEFMSQDQPQKQRSPRNRSFTPDTTNNIPNKLTAGDILSYGTMDQDTNTIVIPINMSVNQDANINNVGSDTRETEISNTLLFPCNEPFNPHMRNESSR
uniref:Uncharacterized protein n=1 Tax=Ciona savignyi TaxID=51511 RepID=H2YP54_CIOSA